MLSAVKATLIRWSVASLLSLFAATAVVSPALAEEDGDEQSQSSGSKHEGKPDVHKDKKGKKKVAAKPKKSSKKVHKSANKKKDKDVAPAKDKSDKKSKDKSDKNADKKEPALVKGVKQDDAKPAADSGKDHGKTTKRARKTVRRRHNK